MVVLTLFYFEKRCIFVKETTAITHFKTTFTLKIYGKSKISIRISSFFNAV